MTRRTEDYFRHYFGEMMDRVGKSNECTAEPPKTESDYNQRLKSGFDLMSEEEVIYYQPWEIRER